ncbi:hypothetical protein ACFWGI_33510, partial [Streptomyces niveus]|uniref:hypothetical protein n=1 Tax=Streptomyces niveus TaxID=193462 RepID=UPI0036486171
MIEDGTGRMKGGLDDAARDMEEQAATLGEQSGIRFPLQKHRAGLGPTARGRWRGGDRRDHRAEGPPDRPLARFGAVDIVAPLGYPELDPRVPGQLL